MSNRYSLSAQPLRNFLENYWLISQMACLHLCLCPSLLAASAFCPMVTLVSSAVRHEGVSEVTTQNKVKARTTWQKQRAG
eukprot:2901994-Pleurochrysis_carterae.AAC.5